MWSHHTKAKPGALIPGAWETLLPADYPMREYILQGVWEGFHIINPDEIKNITPAVMENYKSATFTHRQAVENQILHEIANGRYIITQEKPVIVSALGAIPKKNPGQVRLIHDCSQPEGRALNDYSFHDAFKYQSLQDAIDLITPGKYLAKIDLCSAFRSVGTHPSNHPFAGIKWQFNGDSAPTYMIDTALMFGARRAPEIFNELSQAVRHMAKQQGLDTVAYLDDYLIVSDSREQCLLHLQKLIILLRQLGFAINYSKVEGPAQRLVFLGIVLDTTTMTIELPAGKLTELHTQLQDFYLRQKVTKRQLQSLAGKLNWCTQCIFGGRYHLRRILDQLKGLRKPWHRTRVTQGMKADLHWWLMYMDSFNGTVKMIEERPLTPVVIDACPVASGSCYQGDWCYTPFSGQFLPLCINYKEVLALEPAVVNWGHLWRNHKVIVYSDNQAAVAIINKGSCKDPVVMAALRRIFWSSAMHNFKLEAIYYPCTHNQLADAVSRLHEPNGTKRLALLLWGLTQATGFCVYLPHCDFSCRVLEADIKAGIG